MTSAVSKEEYLKRYLSGAQVCSCCPIMISQSTPLKKDDSGKKKKKKKKHRDGDFKPAIVVPRMRIVDTDVDVGLSYYNIFFYFVFYFVIGDKITPFDRFLVRSLRRQLCTLWEMGRRQLILKVSTFFRLISCVFNSWPILLFLQLLHFLLTSGKIERKCHSHLRVACRRCRGG